MSFREGVKPQHQVIAEFVTKGHKMRSAEYKLKGDKQFAREQKIQRLIQQRENRLKQRNAV